MKKTLQPFIICLLISVFASMACNNYGKKVHIIGTKAEVLYKGEGVTEGDAVKIGEYLKETGFLSKEKAASVQLTKIGDRYVIRFVYNKDYYEKTKDLEKVFQTYGVKMSKAIFDGNKVDIILTDNHFNDFKSIPYTEMAEVNPDEPIKPKEEGDALSKDDFDHDKMGDVTFYWKDISDEESKTIADYIHKSGSFEGGPSQIYMTKSGDRYILRFPVKQEYRNDASFINDIQKISRQIKENVFPNTPYSFQMTDEYLNSVKSFDY